MLPVTTPNSWTQDLDLPSRLFPSRFGFGDLFEGVEMYEEDDEFVLTCDMPGYALEEVTVSWDEGQLYISAEHEDEARNRVKTFHRTFRFPKAIDHEEINAHYQNGVLEIRLPITSAVTKGTVIEVEG